MKSMAVARLKRAHAVELMAEGLSYGEIAARAGYSHRGSAFRAVSKALAEREIEGVAQLRAVELVRLDMLQSAIWDEAMGGDVRAVNMVVRIVAQRSRLLGLDHGRQHHASGPPPVLVVGPDGNPGDATEHPQPEHESWADDRT